MKVKTYVRIARADTGRTQPAGPAHGRTRGASSRCRSWSRCWRCSD